MLADRRSRFCEAAPKFTPVSGLAGGNRRGNRASREVFPLDGGPPRDSPCVNAGSSGATNADDNYKSPHTLPASVVGRRTVPPA
jgi:hypothetical protein